MNMSQNTQRPGIILINKPKGVTSTKCVTAVKYCLTKGIKVGHAGTLDDFASGLLIVCVGREATRLVSFLMDGDKEYIVKAKLGELTNSLDLTGNCIESREPRNINDTLIKEAMAKLQPSYIQIPPIFSALKYNGQPLYDLARKSQLPLDKLETIVKQKAREVTIYEIELLNICLPFFTFRTVVSKGTYMRSVAHDIAQNCNTSATTYELERTRIGKFSLERATPLADIQNTKTIDDYIIPLQEIVQALDIPHTSI